MNEQMIFAQLDFYRKVTLMLFDQIDEVKADVIPHGFNNSIRWNLGHIYVSQENLTLRFAGLEPEFPPGFKELFEGGTKPDEWKLTPPSLIELKQALSAQSARIKKSLEGKLAQAIAYPFSIPGIVEFHTVAETLNFSLYHEGQHTGVIKAMLKAI